MCVKIAMGAILLLASCLVAGQAIGSSQYWREGKLTKEDRVVSIAANEPRPLRQAVESLSEEYGWIIDYEDPVFSDTDSVSKDDAKWAETHPGRHARLPRGGMFESRFSGPAKNAQFSDEERGLVLRKVVSDFNESSYPGKFTVVPGTKGRFAVVGKSTTTSTDLPLFDTIVTLPADNGSALSTIDEITKQVSKLRGISVHIASVPLNRLIQTQVHPSREPASARRLLQYVIDATGITVSWELLYDIDTQAYYLSLKPLLRATTDRLGVRVLRVAP